MQGRAKTSKSLNIKTRQSNRFVDTTIIFFENLIQLSKYLFSQTSKWKIFIYIWRHETF